MPSQQNRCRKSASIPGCSAGCDWRRVVAWPSLRWRLWLEESCGRGHTLGPHWHSNAARSSTICEFSFTGVALWHLWSTEWMCWAFCFPVDGGLNPTRSAPHVDLLSGGPWGGNGGGWEADQTGLPSWLKSLATAQETIRTVELTKLPEIKEGELGSLVVGDWIALISPMMRDLSGSSSKEQLRKPTLSGFVRKPLQRLYVVPRNPIEEDPSWGRVEQRGQSMMVAALPEMLKAEVLANRATSTVEVLFLIFTRYQPGGLGERALLLRQLVERKQVATVGEMMEHLTGWGGGCAEPWSLPSQIQLCWLERWRKWAWHWPINLHKPPLSGWALQESSYRLTWALRCKVSPAMPMCSWLRQSRRSMVWVSKPTAKVKSVEVSPTPKTGRTGLGATPEGKKPTPVVHYSHQTDPLASTFLQRKDSRRDLSALQAWLECGWQVWEVLQLPINSTHQEGLRCGEGEEAWRCRGNQ